MYKRKVKTGKHLGGVEWTDSIYIMSNGKKDLVFKQITSQTAFQNELSSRTKVQPYIRKMPQ